MTTLDDIYEEVFGFEEYLEEVMNEGKIYDKIQDWNTRMNNRDDYMIIQSYCTIVCNTLYRISGYKEYKEEAMKYWKDVQEVKLKLKKLKRDKKEYSPKELNRKYKEDLPTVDHAVTFINQFSKEKKIEVFSTKRVRGQIHVVITNYETFEYHYKDGQEKTRKMAREQDKKRREEAEKRKRNMKESTDDFFTEKTRFFDKGRDVYKFRLRAAIDLTKTFIQVAKKLIKKDILPEKMNKYKKDLEILLEKEKELKKKAKYIDDTNVLKEYKKIEKMMDLYLKLFNRIAKKYNVRIHTGGSWNLGKQTIYDFNDYVILYSRTLYRNIAGGASAPPTIIYQPTYF